MRLLNLVLALLLATSAYGSWFDNEIGLYIDADDNAYWGNALLEAPAAGSYEVFLICYEPVNDATGEWIETLGGYELHLYMPDGWFIQDVVLPPNVINFASAAGSFYCAGDITVGWNGTGYSAERITILATITLGTFLEDPGQAYIFMGPYMGIPSIPGHMAITDANDGYSICRAYPSSGDYELPVMGINAPWIVESETASWSDVKALYR